MADDNKAQDLDMDLKLDESNELEDDLASYGVFVKAGPEDIQEDQGFDQLEDPLDDDELDVAFNEEEESLLENLEEPENEEHDSEKPDALVMEDDSDFGLNNLDIPADDIGDTQEQDIDIDLPEQDIDIDLPEQDIDIDLPEQDIDIDLPEQDINIDLPEQDIDIDLPEQDIDIDLPEQDIDIDLPEQDIDLDDPDFQIEGEADSGIDKSVSGLNLSGADEDITSFDDVAALAESLDQGDSMVEQAIAASENTATSENVLATIERELNAIKSELTDLRQELRRLRDAPVQTGDTPAPPPAPFPETGAETASSGEKGDGGFFSSDDEDETIALTGDELDNILNSAEFTEETGESSYNPEDDMDFESGESMDSSRLSADEEPEDLFKSSDEEIQMMADLDIDEELSGIDDLKDEEEETQLYTGDELEGMELEIPEFSQGDVIDEEMAAKAESAETEIIDEDPADMDATSFDEDEQLLSLPEETAEESQLTSLEEEHQEEPYVESNLEDIQQDSGSSESDASRGENLTVELKHELKAVLSYMDSLLENLPEEKIEEFAQSEHFTTYQKLFEELGL